MCFSPAISFGVGAASWTMATWLSRKDGVLGRRPLMFWYFGFIEFLQLAQYAVADQCGNPVNQALTYLAYVHVAFQPLVVNNYFWGGHSHTKPDLVRFILRVCAFGGVMMLFRLPGMPLGRLGDKLNKWVPDLPTSDMYGKACHGLEASCGPKLCSITGGSMGHISWSVPLLPSTYFVPSANLHAFLFFVPTIVGATGLRRWLMLLTVLVGPVSGMVFSHRDLTTYQFEWPTIWCFFAAIQAAFAMLAELFWPDLFLDTSPAAEGRPAAAKVPPSPIRLPAVSRSAARAAPAAAAAAEAAPAPATVARFTRSRTRKQTARAS